MAAKKTTKRSAAKKRPAAKRGSAKKKPARKPTRAKATQVARKGLKAARGGLDTVFKAGEKTWKTLKSTTAQVVEGVKDSLAGESEPVSKRPRPR
jgi:hypothetical protein